MTNRTTNPSRLDWKKGSSLLIYSRSKAKWFDGVIDNVYIDQDDNKEWFRVRYNKTQSKKIQRFCNDIKPIEPFKCIESELPICILIIHGFIRSIELIINQFIPNDIITVIIRYYETQIFMLMHYITSKDGLSRRMSDREDQYTLYEFNQNQMYSFDIINTAIYDDDYAAHKPFCHIPNISEYTQNVFKTVNTGCYDGILCYSNPPMYSGNVLLYYPTIFIFDRDDCFNVGDENLIKCYKYTAKEAFEVYEKFIFCGTNHGIIASNSYPSNIRPYVNMKTNVFTNKLAQIKLEDIYKDGKIVFNQIKANWKQSELVYMDNREKLFAINIFNKGGFRLFRERNRGQILMDLERECNIFDLNTNECKSGTKYTYKSYDENTFYCSLCSKNDNVYMVTNVGYISNIDLVKNKWNHIYQDVDAKDLLFHFDYPPKVWMNDPYILYCAYQAYSSSIKKNEILFGCIDVREGNRVKPINKLSQFPDHRYSLFLSN